MQHKIIYYQQIKILYFFDKELQLVLARGTRRNSPKSEKCAGKGNEWKITVQNFLKTELSTKD